MLTTSSASVRIAAIGDLLLTARPGSNKPQRGLEALSEEILELFASCDIVFANLECTLFSKDMVSTEPSVFSSESQIRSLKNSGINLVTLGNNHTFDGRDEGFQALRSLLDELEIQHFGAGDNSTQAQAPAIIEINGLKIAFIAVVDKTSGMYRYAEPEASGVALLQTELLCEQIKDLKDQVDHIVISPHWGEERFRIPSPTQIDQAHAFIDAGASIILGHHPHVMQGEEEYKNSPIIYSLGNFLANNVYWNNGDFLTWNRFERTGCILICEVNADGVQRAEQIPVFDDSTSIHIEKNGWGKRYMERANRMLKGGVSGTSYQLETFRVRTILPILAQLRWSKLRRIRPDHFWKAVKLFSQGLK